MFFIRAHARPLHHVMHAHFPHSSRTDFEWHTLTDRDERYPAFYCCENISFSRAHLLLIGSNYWALYERESRCLSRWVERAFFGAEIISWAALKWTRHSFVRFVYISSIQHFNSIIFLIYHYLMSRLFKRYMN